MAVEFLERRRRRRRRPAGAPVDVDDFVLHDGTGGVLSLRTALSIVDELGGLDMAVGGWLARKGDHRGGFAR